MKLRKYQKEAARTMATCKDSITDDLHMVLGMQTEVAEIADVYKKHIAYCREIDFVNVKEELGDIVWYIANMCNLHGWDLEDILETNIHKLKLRYPNKFTREKALNRDLKAERKILENTTATNHSTFSQDTISTT